MTTDEYHTAEMLFLKSIAVVESFLFLILILWLNRYDLLCYSIIGSYFLQRARRWMGNRSILLVISAGFGLCYCLLELIETSMPLTYSVTWIHYWGYCKNISEPVHYAVDYRCPDVF